MIDLTDGSELTSFSLSVHPIPTTTERDAIVAALSVVLARRQQSSLPSSAIAPPSRWKHAGVLEQHIGIDGGVPSGWGISLQDANSPGRNW